MPLSPDRTDIRGTRRSDALMRVGTFVFAAALILIAVYCRVRLLSVPLERDEGGFAYIGQQILRGYSPFESANMKVIGGIHFAYALMMAMFGESSRAIHSGLLLVNISSLPLVYLLARRVVAAEHALLAAGAYAYLSASQTVLGVAAHATHFVVLFVLTGLVALLKGLDENRRPFIIIAGLCFGMSFLMKQHGAFFCVFALCASFWHQHTRRIDAVTLVKSLCLLGGSMLMPYLAISMYMMANGVFAEFWFWTVTYSLDYAGLYSVSQGMKFLEDKIRNFLWYQKYVWCLGGFGLMVSCLPGMPVRNRGMVLGFLLFSLFAIVPGNAYYRHYFILVMPALAILVGVGSEALTRFFGKITGHAAARTAAWGIVFSAFAVAVYQERDYLFRLGPDEVSRTMYWNDLFPVSVEIARYVREHSERSAKIAIIGSEPQIYFYAQRSAATSYLYMYGLDRPHPYVNAMQDEMISEIETASPEYIIYARVYDSWLDGRAGDRIVNSINSYLMYYTQVGLVELGTNEKSICYWGPDAASRLPVGIQSISIFRRDF